MNKYILFTILLIACPQLVISQIIKADTILGEKKSKYIEVTKRMGSYVKTIENGDTVIFPFDMLYWNYQEDSMEIVIDKFIKSSEYLGRDTINIKNLEYVYIKQVYETQSSWSHRNLYNYLIYDKRIKGQTDGFICSLGNHTKDQGINCYSKSLTQNDLLDMINILNKYMAFESVPVMTLPKNFRDGPIMWSKKFYIEIIVKEKNRTEIIRTLTPHEGDCFGLHEKLKGVLHDFWNNKLNSSKNFKHFYFLVKNEEKFIHKEKINEIKSYVEINK